MKPAGRERSTLVLDADGIVVNADPDHAHLLGMAVTLVDAPARPRSSRPPAPLSDARERLDAEIARQLRESEQRFRATFEQASTGFAHVGLDGKFLRVNDRLADLLGFSRNDLLSRTFSELTIPDEREGDLTAARELALGTRAVYSRDKRYMRQDGSFIWCHLTTTCVRDERGRPEYFFSVLEDITDRKNAEGARARSESLLRATLEATVDGIVATDLDGHFVDCNGAFLRMWNIAVTDLAPSRFLLAPAIIELVQYKEAYVSCLEDLFAHPDVEGFDVLELGDGRVIERHSRPQRVGESIVGRVFSFRDVTDRVRAELAVSRVRERSVEAEKMEAIGRLAGGIAHDFNNLLTVITSYSELLLRKRLSTDGSQLAISEIIRASERAATLTSQLLAFGRKQMLRPEVIDLNGTLSMLRGSLERLVGPGIELEYDLDTRPQVVSADPAQVDQVVMNLVVNARDAMAESGGKIVCSTRTTRLEPGKALELGDIDPGLYSVLSVRDTGAGMTPDVLARVFEPFFTTKETGKGTGLGLATVFGIVRQSNGAITMESELGVGTLAQVFLPVSDAAPSGISDYGRGPIEGGTETILVVEDSDAVRRLTTSVLESFGYSVVAARDAADGLRTFVEAKGTIQAVITDVVMPGMSGRDLVRLIRARDGRVPILLLSGYNEAIAATESEHLEGFPFLAKPFTPDDLGRRIRMLLDGSR